MLSMRSVKCHKIKMVQVVSKLVKPDNIKRSGGAPHHFKPSPGIFAVVRPSPYSRLVLHCIYTYVFFDGHLIRPDCMYLYYMLCL